ncbi:hypothetical protein KQI63_04255 [bacterium]|nr:hypothetical protein [bacterium]
MRSSSTLLRRMVAGLALVAMLIGVTGCPGGGGPTPPTPDARSYGPPLNAITFVELGGYLGTASPTAGAIAMYVPGVGNSTEILDPGYSVTWMPGSSLEGNSRLLTGDSHNSRLVLIDQNGLEMQEFLDGSPEMYQFSGAGSRLAYVKDLESSQQLVIEGVGSISDFTLIAELLPPYRFASIPSYHSTAGRVAISEFNDTNPSLSRLAFYTTGGSLSNAVDQRVYSPSFNDAGSRCAYIDGENGAAAATDLVIIDGNLAEVARYDFSGFGTGACALSWSPDDSRIALFAGIYSDSPRLLIYDISNLVAQELEQTFGTIAANPTDHPNWCYPEWSPSGDSITMFVSVNDSYSLVEIDLLGNGEVLLDEINAPSKPNWLDTTN